MAEENKNVEPETVDEEQVEENVEGQEEQEEGDSLSIDQVKELIKKEREEERRDWQSRFDKVLEEKKTTEKAKMTTQEQLDALQNELKNEKLTNAREKAVSSAGLDSDIVKAAEMIVSDDLDALSTGAEAVKTYLDNKAETMAKEMYEQMVKEKYASGKPPKAGVSADALETRIKEAKDKGDVASLFALKREQSQMEG